MQPEDWSAMKLSPAAFNEGDLQSTFHQPGVLNEQVRITLWTDGLNLEWEEGLVSVNEHRKYLQQVTQTPGRSQKKSIINSATSKQLHQAASITSVFYYQFIFICVYCFNSYYLFFSSLYI